MVVCPPVRPKAPTDTHSGTLAHGRIKSSSNKNTEFNAVQDARVSHDANAWVGSLENEWAGQLGITCRSLDSEVDG